MKTVHREPKQYFIVFPLQKQGRTNLSSFFRFATMQDIAKRRLGVGYPYVSSCIYINLNILIYMGVSLYRGALSFVVFYFGLTSLAF